MFAFTLRSGFVILILSICPCPSVGMEARRASVISIDDATSLSSRIRSQDLSALKKALLLLNTADVRDEGLAKLLRSIEEVVLSDSLSLLSEGLESPQGDLRQAVSFALRKLDTPKVVPLLAKAINDPDPRVSYNAAIGLYSHERRSIDNPAYYVAPMGTFTANSAYYRGNWNTWYNSGGRQKYDDSSLNGVTASSSTTSYSSFSQETMIDVLIADAEAYYADAKTRNRDIAIQKFQRILDARPGNAANIRYEFNIGVMLIYRMNPAFESPAPIDAMVIFERMLTRYLKQSKDMRLLLARNYLAGLYRQLENDELRAEEIYFSILDMPDTEMQLPEDWISEQELRREHPLSFAEFSEYHSDRVDFIKHGAMDGIFTIKLSSCMADSEKMLSVLTQLSTLRKDNGLYQARINAKLQPYQLHLGNQPSMLPSTNKRY